MKKVFTVILATVLVSSFFAACQATPESEVVVGKGDGELEKAIKATPQVTENLSSLQIPVTWQETVQSIVMDVDINIDANISVPNVSSYSVYGVEPVPFTEEQITKLCGVLFGDREKYEFDNVKSKEEYQEMIFDLKAYLAELQRHKEDSSMSEEEYSEEVNRVNNLISHYSSEYENAPDTISRIPIDTIEFSDFDVWNGINIMSKTDDGQWDYLRVANDENNLGNNLVYYIDSMERDLAPQVFQGDCIDGLSLSLKDAETLANDLIDKLGLAEDYSIYAVYTEGYNASETYMIRFAKTIGGVQESLIGKNWGVSAAVYADQDVTIEGQSDEYREPWLYEYIEIDVKENGITSITWQRPGEIVQTINQNVTMLSYEKVQEVFINQISILNFESGSYKVVNVNINKIVLGLMRIPVQNTSHDYYLLPVWDFFGEVTTDKGTILVNDDSFLTINAIDGSVVNRGLGY